MTHPLQRKMFKAQTGAAVQQGGGYTAAVRRAIAAGDRRAIQELAKPVNYGDAARTPDAQQAMALARRNLAPTRISTAPTVDTGVSEAAQISMPQNLPTTVQGLPGRVMGVLGQPPSVLLQRGPGEGPSATNRAAGMSISDTDTPAAAPSRFGIGDIVPDVVKRAFTNPQVRRSFMYPMEMFGMPVPADAPGVAPPTVRDIDVSGVMTTLLPKMGASDASTAAAPAGDTPAPAASGVDPFAISSGLPTTNFETQVGVAPQVPMLLADRVAAGLAFDMNNPFKPQTETQEAASEETGSSATSETQAAAESDSKKAAGEAGATTIGFGDPLDALNTAAAGTAGQSDQERTLRADLDLLTQAREGLSTASEQRVAMAQSRVGQAAAQLEAALSKDPKRAKEITLSEVKDEALKLTGFDEEKYSKGRGDAFWMGLMRAGLAIAGGESENAITNIAKGLGIGLEGYGRDLNVLSEQEREDRKELRNTQLLLVKNKQDLENAWVAQENAYQDRLIQLRAAQEQGAQSNLIAAQTADAQLQLATSQLDVTSAKAIADSERADKKIDADNAFRVWSTKINALPTEVKQTVFLGPDMGTIDENGDIAFTEEGEKFYKELILASTKKSVKPTDLLATVNAYLDSDRRAIGGYLLPENDSIARAAAFAWERDDVAELAQKARESVQKEAMVGEDVSQEAQAAYDAVITRWAQTYDLKPINQKVTKIPD
jgi:hypothetical protein